MTERTGEDVMAGAVRSIIIAIFVGLTIVGGFCYGMWWLIHHLVTK